MHGVYLGLTCTAGSARDGSHHGGLNFPDYTDEVKGPWETREDGGDAAELASGSSSTAPIRQRISHNGGRQVLNIILNMISLPSDMEDAMAGAVVDKTFRGIDRVWDRDFIFVDLCARGYNGKKWREDKN